MRLGQQVQGRAASCAWPLLRGSFCLHFKDPASNSYSQCVRQRHARCRALPWRPHIDDVDRLSRGDGARQRGTGSRDIPHRLNAEERPVYESAKKKGFLAVRGTGYRRERKGNPLPNIYRQWCDAKGMACVVIEQDWAGGGQDIVVVDLSTLRLRDAEFQQAEASLLHLAQQMGLAPVPHGAHTVPFNIIPPSSPSPPAPKAPKPAKAPQQSPESSMAVQLEAAARRRMGSGSAADQAARVATAEQRVNELEQQAEAAAAEVRRLKEEEGWPNSAPLVREGVALLKSVRAQLDEARNTVELARMPYASRRAALFDAFDEPTPSSIPQLAQQAIPEGPQLMAETTPEAGQAEPRLDGASQSADAPKPPDGAVTASGKTESDQVPEDDPEHPRMKLAIWALHARPVFFTAERSEAKIFAKEAAALLSASSVQSSLQTDDAAVSDAPLRVPVNSG